MQVEIDIPKGRYCVECCRLSDFWVNEMEYMNYGDESPKYVRELTAQCTLFGETVRGGAIVEMYKCAECLKKSEN